MHSTFRVNGVQPEAAACVAKAVVGVPFNQERRRLLASVAGTFGTSMLISNSFAEDSYKPGFFEKLFQSIPGRPASALVGSSLRRSCRSVVRVITNGGEGGGSGILLGDDWLLTACHVLGEAWQRQATESIIVTDFDVEYPTEARCYFVLAPEKGFYSVSEKDGNNHLDYTLSKLKPAFPLRSHPATARGLRAALPLARGECWECVAIGHPESLCEAAERRWAYRTFKHSIARRSAVANWELLISGLTCGGMSGGPILALDGTFFGMVSSQNKAKKDTDRGRVVSAVAIADDARPRLEQLGLVLPPGLLMTEFVPQQASVNSDCYPVDILYERKASEAEPLEKPNQPVLLSQLHSGVSTKRASEIESCVGYISLLPPTSPKPQDSYGRQGTCFRVGHDWVLTAKHVVDCPARADTVWLSFRFASNADFAQFPLIEHERHIGFLPHEYYSSDDRAFSYNGVEVVLDYALMKIRWPKSGPFVPNELERTQYLRVSSRDPTIGQTVLIPQHRDNRPRAWYDSKEELGDPIVQSVDTRRVYHSGSTYAGASGAPILVPISRGSDLALIGLHTHPHVPKCGVEKDRRGDDDCLPIPYWERHRLSEEQRHSFGANIYAVMQDLVLRHKFDLNRVEGFRDVLPYIGARYGGGSA